MSDSINREDVIRMAKESGFKACVGTTDKEGNYHPFVNALGKDIPIEWLERFAALAALRAQPAVMEPKPFDFGPARKAAELRAQPDHSELVKKLRRCRTSWPPLNTLLNEAAGALEGKAIGETK